MALSDDEVQWLEGLLDLTEDAGLVGFEENFVADQRKRFKEYGAEMRLSPKQYNILFGIAEDCGYDLPPGKVYDRPAWKR